MYPKSNQPLSLQFEDGVQSSMVYNPTQFASMAIQLWIGQPSLFLFFVSNVFSPFHPTQRPSHQTSHLGIQLSHLASHSTTSVNDQQGFPGRTETTIEMLRKLQKKTVFSKNWMSKNVTNLYCGFPQWQIALQTIYEELFFHESFFMSNLSIYLSVNGVLGFSESSEPSDEFVVNLRWVFSKNLANRWSRTTIFGRLKLLRKKITSCFNYQLFPWPVVSTTFFCAVPTKTSSSVHTATALSQWPFRVSKLWSWVQPILIIARLKKPELPFGFWNQYSCSQL